MYWTRAGINFRMGLSPEELLDVIKQSVETTQQQMAKGEPCQPGERGGTSSREVVAAAQRRRVLSSNWLRWLVLAILLSLLTAMGIRHKDLIGRMFETRHRYYPLEIIFRPIFQLRIAVS